MPSFQQLRLALTSSSTGRSITWGKAVAVCAVAATAAGIGTSFAAVPSARPLTAQALRADAVPPQLLPYVRKAAGRCTAVTAPLIAAQADVNADWRPNSVDPSGAKGLGRFVSATWAEFGVDGDGDGRKDPFSAADALVAQADYLCWIDRYLRRQGLTQDRLGLTVAAYRMGPGALRRLGRVPASGPTADYVAAVRGSVRRYQLATAPKAADPSPRTPTGLSDCRVDTGGGCIWSDETATFSNRKVSAVRALAAGVVRDIGTDRLGSWVLLDHGNDLRTKYSGLSSVSLRIGQRVDIRTPVGFSLSTVRAPEVILGEQVLGTATVSG